MGRTRIRRERQRSGLQRQAGRPLLGPDNRKEKRNDATLMTVRNDATLMTVKTKVLCYCYGRGRLCLNQA